MNLFTYYYLELIFMRNRSALFNVYFAVLATLTAAATVLRTVALMRDMNYASGHFNEKLIIGIADKLLLVLAIVVTVISLAH